MATESSAASLAREMREERGLFERFAQEEAGLTRLVQARDWEGLERTLTGLETLAARIEAIEASRHGRYQGLKQELGVGDRAGFALVASRLPDAERERLATCRDDLREAVARVRTLSASLAYYFRSVKESVEQILGEVFPHRRGRIYSRQGRPAEAGSDPVVVNHRL